MIKLFRKTRKPIPVAVVSFPNRQAVCIRKYNCQSCKIMVCAMRRER